MLKSSDIIDNIICSLQETSVMFDASDREKLWIVKSISLSKGFQSL
jgi:hypothetical protein